jgi:hypothetical protein
MADIEDRHTRLVAQALDVRQDLDAALLVERGQRLVHQQQARMGEQGAADRDALLLAARQRVGPRSSRWPMPSSSTTEPSRPRAPSLAREPAP